MIAPVLGAFGGQVYHDPGENTVVAAAFPLVVEGLGWAICNLCATPSQPIAIDEDYAAEDAMVINVWIAMALGKEGL